MTYDTLKDMGKENDYHRVNLSISRIGIISSILFALTGALLYMLYFRLAYLTWAFLYLIAFILIFSLDEPQAHIEPMTIRSYLKRFKDGIFHLFQPSLIRYDLLIIVMLALNVIFMFSILEPSLLIRFGYNASGQNIVQAIGGILVTLMLSVIPIMRKRFSDFAGLAIFSTIIGFAYFIAIFPLGFIGAIVIVLIRGGGSLIATWTSVVINREIDSQYRATALSTLSLLSNVPYVFISIIAGSVIQSGHIDSIIVTITTIILCTVCITGVIIRNQPMLIVVKKEQPGIFDEPGVLAENPFVEMEQAL